MKVNYHQPFLYIMDPASPYPVAARLLRYFTPAVLSATLFFSAITQTYAAFPVLLVSNQTQQARVVSGRVVDEENNPLPGSRILEKGTTNEAITDADGEFSITLRGTNNPVLVFSYVGYRTIEVGVSVEGNLLVRLEQAQRTLEDVIVTGYAPQSRESITGSVNVLDVSQIQDMPDGNVLRSLQGRVTGLQVGKSGGPGGDNMIRIRGFSNVSTNDPLYIIDGMPTQDGSIFNALNPADIEAIQVLKDASSTAIYGSRASNGVIIVTTKSGAKAREKAELNVNYAVGAQTPRREAFPQFLNPTEYGDWLWERMRPEVAQNFLKYPKGNPVNPIFGDGPNPVVPTYITGASSGFSGVSSLTPADIYNEQTNPIKEANKSGTRWLDEIFKTSQFHNLNISVAKSADKSSYYFSTGYYKNDGILTYTGFDRLSIRMNSSYKVNDLITIGENFTVSYNKIRGNAQNQVEFGPILMAQRINPIIPVYDIAGNFAGTKGAGLGNAYNPYGLLRRSKDDNISKLNVFGNAYIQLDFSKWVRGLGFETRVNMDYTYRGQENYTARRFEQSEPQTQNNFIKFSANTINETYTNFFKYANDFGKSRVSALAGVEYIKQSYDGFDATRFGYFNDDINFRYLSTGGATGQLNSGIGNQASLFSLFFKGDYAYDGRYFVTAVLRNDESSRFLDKNRSRLFPSIGVSWRISEENFMKDVSLINNLKLRASWGQTGNQATTLAYPAYSYSSTNAINNDYDIVGNSIGASSGIALQQTGNPDLRWEVVTSTDIGVEASFFNNKLALEAVYYDKQTSDMLVQVHRAGVEGLGASPWRNIGSMSNRGFEIALSHQNTFKSGWSYTIGVNLSRNYNKVTKLLDDEKAFIAGRDFRGSSVTRTSTGNPISYFFGYQVDDSNPFYRAGDDLSRQTGAVEGGFRYKDINGDGKIDADDRTVIGSSLPKLIYGINLAVGYKNFELTSFLEGQYGNQIFNQTRYFTDFETFSGSALNRRVLNFPVNSNAIKPETQTFASSYFIESGSFLRIRNIQLSYNFSEKIIKTIGLIKGIRLYFQVENAFVFTKYSGLDPEVNLPSTGTFADTNFNLGIDQGIYPNPRSFIFGINVKI